MNEHAFPSMVGHKMPGSHGFSIPSLHEHAPDEIGLEAIGLSLKRGAKGFQVFVAQFPWVPITRPSGPNKTPK